MYATSLRRTLLLAGVAGATLQLSCRFDGGGTRVGVGVGWSGDALDVGEQSNSDAVVERDLRSDGLPVAADIGAVDAPPADGPLQDAWPADIPTADAWPYDGGTLACDSGLVALVACYTFDEGESTATIVDHSAFGNDGDRIGGSFVAGWQGLALRFPADSVTVPDSASLDVTAQLTIEANIYPTALPTSGRQGIFDNQGHYGLFLHPAGQTRCTAAGQTLASPEGAIAAARWQHVACTYDGSALRLFVDGTELALGNPSGDIVGSGTTGSAIGQNSPTGDHFVGLIDNLRVWNVSRTPQELRQDAGP